MSDVNILVVDDQAGDQHAQFELQFTDGDSRPRVRHPKDVDEDDLRWADVVLVDYRIEDWPEREDVECIGQRPLFGVALAGVYREYVDRLQGKSSLTALVVHTGHLEDLSHRLPKEQSAHIVARLNNLEWAFRKDEADLPQSVRALGEAVRALPHPWPTDADDASALVKALLALEGDESWAERCWDEVLRCQPPLFDLVAGAHGLVLLRWLLHLVLPHPTFLIDEHYLAVHLRLPLPQLREVLAGDSVLNAHLTTLEYRGVLHGFQGRRWWRGAVQQFTWSQRQEAGGDLHAGLRQLAGTNLDSLSSRAPCVCVGRDLRPTGQVADIEDVVRLVPDLWPAHADPPMAEIESVRADPLLAAIVHPLDEERLSAGEE